MGTIEVDNTLSLDSMVVASSEQLASDLAGEVIILDLKSGIYYGLNSVGARIWSLLQEPRTVCEIRDIILDEYEVDPDRCEQDLMAVLSELLSRALIEVKNETAA